MNISPLLRSWRASGHVVTRLVASDLERRAYLLFGGVLSATALSAALALIYAPNLGNIYVLTGLALAAAVAERSRVGLGNGLDASIAMLPILFAAVLYGPLPAMIVGCVSYVSDLRRPFLKWGVFTCVRAVTGAASGFVALAAVGATSSNFGAIALGTGVAALTAELVDGVFACLAYAARKKGQMSSVVRIIGPLAIASVPLYAPVVALLIVAYRDMSPWTLPLFLAPALAAQRLFVLYQGQRRLADDLAAANLRLERANLSFTAALVTTLDARDRYTAGHSAAVAVYARDIAKRMGLTEEVQTLAHQCGLVHDIGKIGLPAGLLEKPGALTLEERRQMERHAEIGQRILKQVDDYIEVATIVRHHHERVDGNGYPDRIEGEQIPLISRILAVADAYNAMTSDRPYRDAMPTRVARLRLAQAVESQFDTAVVAAFEAILAGASEEYRCARGAEFLFHVETSAPRLRASGKPQAA